VERLKSDTTAEEVLRNVSNRLRFYNQICPLKNSVKRSAEPILYHREARTKKYNTTLEITDRSKKTMNKKQHKAT